MKMKKKSVAITHVPTIALLLIMGSVTVWNYRNMFEMYRNSSRITKTFTLADTLPLSKTYIKNGVAHSSSKGQTILPNKRDSTSFAACLLTMDDNALLVEWLAYHYHVLPLKNLIIAVDPRSVTSPSDILNRYEGLMNITIWWNDEDYISNMTEVEEAKEWARLKFQNDKPSPTLVRHRARQRLFYYHCLQEHKRSQRTWTMLTDSDEYLRINYESVATLRYHDQPPPPIDKAGSVIQFLEKDIGQHPDNNITGSPCIQIPRSRFSIVESDTELIQKSISSTNLNFLNASEFSTLRWLHHAKWDNYKQNRISKVIVDLSRIEWNFLSPVDSIHLPIRQYCGRRKLHIRSPHQLFLIHHYLSSYQQFSSRNDARAGGKERSVDLFKKSAKLKQATSDTITPWLRGFIKKNGYLQAQQLLKQAH